MRSAVLCLALTACGAPLAVHTSPCGLTLNGTSDTFDVAACDAVRFISDVYGADRTERVAAQFSVSVDPAIAFGPLAPAGETFCADQYGYAVIALIDDDWYPGALAHELAHAVTCGNPNPNHVGWDTDGTFAAIERFHAEMM